MEPLLQIVHISDLHFRLQVEPFGLTKLRQSLFLLPRLTALINKGIQPHDEAAREKFLDFFMELRAGEGGRFKDTVLLDTGDLSTLGDPESLEEGTQFLKELETSGVSQVVCLQGNHDAWPRDLPLFAPPGVLDEHEQWLRREHYPNKWPEEPLKWSYPEWGFEIQLFGLETVIHDRFWNTAAVGKVSRPRPHAGDVESVAQLARLRSHVESNDTGGAVFRILASHHLIGLGGQRSNRWDRVRDGDNVFAQLQDSQHPFHLILSGHTHRLYPEWTTLTSAASEPIQMVVGSLLQRPHPEASAPAAVPRFDSSYQAQILRFYARGCTILMERRWVVLDAFGAYQVVGERDCPTEECLTYAVLANGLERLEVG